MFQYVSVDENNTITETYDTYEGASNPQLARRNALNNLYYSQHEPFHSVRCYFGF